MVDHDDRRREIVEATWRIISSAGLANATTREIAREAGYSNGVLAHYFHDKADILASTLVTAHRGVRQRTDEQLDTLTGLEALRVLMLESLPLDDQRILEAKVEISFWGQAIGNDVLIETQNREVDGFRARVRRCLDEARGAGDLKSGIDIDQTVDELHVLMDGLSVQAVFYPAVASRATQLALLDAVLERIAAPRPAQQRRTAGSAPRSRGTAASRRRR